MYNFKRSTTIAGSGSVSASAETSHEVVELPTFDPELEARYRCAQGATNIEAADVYPQLDVQEPACTAPEEDTFEELHEQDDGDDGEVPGDAQGSGAFNAATGGTRGRRADVILAQLNPPGEDASTAEVLRYFRELVGCHNVTPPKPWRQIRFDLPRTIAELQLYPSTSEEVQYSDPVRPSPCLVLLLEGAVPAEMTIAEYSAQMVKYLIDLMKYQNASTAITTLRFVKKGTDLSQLVVTFGKDIRLATRILEQLQSVGLPAGYGQPILDYPPNATFQITDYRSNRNEGKSISSEDLLTLLTPFRQSQTVDIHVIEGYEPGIYYAPVKRPETIYSFLWNPFCSFIFQSALFERFGVLVTMALCTHEFLQKGVPYHIQKQLKEQEMQRLKQQQADGVDKPANPLASEAVGGEDETEAEDGRPDWAAHAMEEVDIFDAVAPADAAASGSKSHIATTSRASVKHMGLTFVDEDEDAEVEALLRAHHVTSGAHSSKASEASGNAKGTTMLRAPERDRPSPSHVPPNATVNGNVHHGNGRDGGAPPNFLSPYASAARHTGPGFGRFSQPPLFSAASAGFPSAHLPPQNVYDPSEGPVSGSGKDNPPLPGNGQQSYPQLVDDDDDDENGGGAAKRRQHMPPPPEPNADHAQMGGPSSRLPSMQSMWMLPPPLPQPPRYNEFSGWAGPMHPYGRPDLSIPLARPLSSEGQPPARYNVLPFPEPLPMMEERPMRNSPSVYPSPVGYAPALMRGPPGTVPAHFAPHMHSHPVAPPQQHFTMNDPHRPLPPQVRQQRLPVHPEEALRVAQQVEELVSAAFPREWEMQGLAKPSPDDPNSKVSCIMDTVPVTARVPRPTAELEDLTDFIERECTTLCNMLECTAAQLAEPRQRIARAFMVAAPGCDETHDWALSSVEAASDTGTCEERETQETMKEARLPVLLPYLLTSHEGTELVAALATHFYDQLAPLLARYVLPFLLDANVVQWVCGAALRRDPTENNIIVQRVLQHWVALTEWLHERIKVEAAHEVEQQRQKLTGMERDTVADNERATTAKRLISQAGNTIDALLAGLSVAHRRACRIASEENKMIEIFVQTLMGHPQSNDSTTETVASDSTTACLSAGTMQLWGTDGAVRRTLLRLYLNADVLSGRQLFASLFPPSVQLTRDHFYFSIVALSKSLVSPSLSQETAAFCGAFLRQMEVSYSQSTSAAPASKSDYLGEEEAGQLVEAALRSISSDEVYHALQSTYFVEHEPNVARFKSVQDRLSSVSAPAKAGAHGSARHPHQHAVLPHSHLASTPSALQPKNSGQRLAVDHHRRPYQAHESGKVVEAEKPSSSVDATGGKPVSAWLQEWTAAMCNYCAIGDPFTPLPPGWTSSLSRTYGHYYFKHPKEPPSYKHPTDATQFMVTPQAFLREPGVTTTLEDAVHYVNSRASSAGNEVTDEVAETWFNDQRVRHEALDLAVLELLSIKYRVGGRAHSLQTTVSSHTTGRKRSRSPHSQRDLATWLEPIRRYPAKGYPFPLLHRGWTVNLSSSNGLYYFRPPRGDPVYRHPGTRREYRASPQAFVAHRELDFKKIAEVSGKAVVEVEEWMEDQRYRSREIDGAVVKLIPITYTLSEDVDDTRMKNGPSAS